MRAYEVCQNPLCNHGDPVRLDDVRPPLRRDAKWCGRACREEGTQARRDALEGRVNPERFWAGIAARRTRESRTTMQLHARCMAARRAGKKRVGRSRV